MTLETDTLPFDMKNVQWGHTAPARPTEPVEITLENFWENKYCLQSRFKESVNGLELETKIFRDWLITLAHYPLHKISAELIEKAVVGPMLMAENSLDNIHSALVVLSRILIHAIYLNFFSGENPVVKVKQPLKRNKRHRFLTEDEAIVLFARLKAVSIDVHDMALLSLLCGLHLKQCQALTWADVDFKNKLLFIKDSKRVQILDRHAHLITDVETMLKNRYKGQPKTQRIIQKYNNGRYFKCIVASMGLNNQITDFHLKVNFRILRHTFASWLVQRGVSLNNVQQLIGQKNTQAMMDYAHLLTLDTQTAPDMILEGATAAMLLEGILDGKMHL